MGAIIIIVIALVFCVVVGSELATNEKKIERQKKIIAEERHKQREKDINSVIEFAQKYGVDISEHIKRRNSFYNMAARNYATNILTGGNDIYLIKNTNNYIEKYRNVEKVILSELRNIPNRASIGYIQLLEAYFNDDYTFFKIGE